MPGKRRLRPEERAFFTLVNRAAFSNPFSDERAELDSAISQLPADESREARISGVMKKVSAKIDRLDRSGFVKLGDFSKKDGEILGHTFLFYVYHQFAEQFDRLIERQFSNEDVSERVMFSRDFLSSLTARGGGPGKAAAKYLGFETPSDAFRERMKSVFRKAIGNRVLCRNGECVGKAS